MEPIIVEINKKRILVPQDAVQIRTAYDLDKHDKNQAQPVHFFFGDKIKGATKAFLTDLFEPSMKADRRFGFAKQLENGALEFHKQEMGPGNYILIRRAAGDPDARTIGEILHFTINLHEGYEQPRIMRHQMREHLESGDPLLTAIAMKIMKGHPEYRPRIRVAARTSPLKPV